MRVKVEWINGIIATHTRTRNIRTFDFWLSYQYLESSFCILLLHIFLFIWGVAETWTQVLSILWEYDFTQSHKLGHGMLSNFFQRWLSKVWVIRINIMLKEILVTSLTNFMLKRINLQYPSKWERQAIAKWLTSFKISK